MILVVAQAVQHQDQVYRAAQGRRVALIFFPDNDELTGVYHWNETLQCKGERVAA